MNNRWLTFILLGLVSISGFFITLYFLPLLERQEINQDPQTTFVIRPIEDWIFELEKCVQRAGKNRISDCHKIALQFAKNLKRQGARYGLRMNTMKLFHLYIMDDTLIYLKDNCTDKDVQTDIFPINYYPRDLRNIPEKRRKRGLLFINQASSFKKTGFRLKDICLMAIKLKIKGYDIRQLQTGQHNGRKWTWSVLWKL